MRPFSRKILLTMNSVKPHLIDGSICYTCTRTYFVGHTFIFYVFIRYICRLRLRYTHTHTHRNALLPCVWLPLRIFLLFFIKSLLAIRSRYHLFGADFGSFARMVCETNKYACYTHGKHNQFLKI